MRGWLLTGFPWGNIGYSQWNYHAGIQIASIAGVYGVSFVIVFFNSGIATLIRRRHEWQKELVAVIVPRRRHEWQKELVAVIVPCLLAAITLIYGYIVIRKSDNIETQSLKDGFGPWKYSST